MAIKIWAISFRTELDLFYIFDEAKDWGSSGVLIGEITTIALNIHVKI